MKTIVKVYLKDEHGNKDWFVTPINLPEQEAHENYIGKRFNIGIDTDHICSVLFERQIKCCIFEAEIRENS